MIVTTPMLTRTDASRALADIFTGDYGRLTQPQRDALCAQLLAATPPAHDPTLHGTARALRDRLGTQTLAHYARSLPS